MKEECISEERLDAAIRREEKEMKEERIPEERLDVQRYAEKRRR